MQVGDFVVESKIKALVVGDPWLRDNGGIPCGKKGSRCGASPPELDAAAANQLILGNEADLVRKPEETRLFAARDRTPAKVAWRIESADGKAALVGVNSGDRRLRIADLRLRDEHGGEVSFGGGLRGYVLGHSLVRWRPARGGDIGRLRGHVFVDATTEGGAIHVAADATPP